MLDAQEWGVLAFSPDSASMRVRHFPSLPFSLPGCEMIFSYLPLPGRTDCNLHAVNRPWADIELVCLIMILLLNIHGAFLNYIHAFLTRLFSEQPTSVLFSFSSRYARAFSPTCSIERNTSEKELTVLWHLLFHQRQEISSTCLFVLHCPNPDPDPLLLSFLYYSPKRWWYWMSSGDWDPSVLGIVHNGMQWQAVPIPKDLMGYVRHKVEGRNRHREQRCLIQSHPTGQCQA